MCLTLCLTVCPAAYLVEGIPCASPCAFALLGRDTQRVWGLGEATYLDKIYIIALSKEAIHELINLDIILGSFLDGVSGAPDDSL